MGISTVQSYFYLSVAASLLLVQTGQAQKNNSVSSPQYHIYAGNTHAHTSYTWSHGEQFLKSGCKGVPVYGPDHNSPEVSSWTSEGGEARGNCPAMIIMGSSQYPGPYGDLKPDWKKFQGPPSEHFRLAKENGYDFYAVTDHSQEAIFQPASPTNPAWLAIKREAVEATTPQFVAIAGYEHSENDGPNGVGHLNVFNSAGYMNALDPGVDLPSFYKWLKTAKSNGAGPVVVSFNHPGAKQYNNWDYRDPEITDIITMLEVINSNNHIHEEGFINALDKGWKVSPVSGNDNHGTAGISQQTSRTFLLATSRTKVALLDAMKHRRTYASLDRNIQCTYTVNGQIMGSTLHAPEELTFKIEIQDPDTDNPRDKITKIDIVGDGGVVVQTYEPSPAYSVTWSPVIKNSTNKYFFVRVWNEGGGDAPKPDPNKPVAWLAPVWTGR
jgi:hypothetical protein